MGTLFGADGELLERQYRNHLSGYLCWEQLPHAEEWLLFEKNIGVYVGLDEVCLSRGELYTVLINKERKGRSGSLIAVVKGTDVKTVTSVLLRLSRRRRFQVREITMGYGSEHGADRPPLFSRRTPRHRPFPCAETRL